MKYFTLVLFLLLSLICFDAYANVYTANAPVNIRECASTKCKILGSLIKGQEISGELRPSGWVKSTVKLKNSKSSITGYIAKKYLTEKTIKKTENEVGIGEAFASIIILFLFSWMMAKVAKYMDNDPSRNEKEKLEKFKRDLENIKKQEAEEELKSKIERILEIAKPTQEYYRNGNLYREGKIYRNKKYGLWKQYDKKGNLEYIMQYYDDKLNGITKGYDKQGYLTSEANFVDGTLSGVAKTYYRHGAVNTEAFYVDGKLKGIEKTYDNVGRLIRERAYDEDQVINIKLYDDNGKIQTDASYKDGLLNGETITYDKAGNITCIAHYKDGVLENLEDIDENGNQKIVRTFESGILKSAESSVNSSSDNENVTNKDSPSSIKQKKKPKNIKRRLEL